MPYWYIDITLLHICVRYPITLFQGGSNLELRRLLRHSHATMLDVAGTPLGTTHFDLTGAYGSSGGERESLLWRAGHADKAIQGGADRDAAAVV